jgi:hypothetical protein
MVNYQFFNHCFLVDKHDTLEYSWEKAIMVSVRLQIFLCALINTNNTTDVTKHGTNLARVQTDMEASNSALPSLRMCTRCKISTRGQENTLPLLAVIIDQIRLPIK